MQTHIIDARLRKREWERERERERENVLFHKCACEGRVRWSMQSFIALNQHTDCTWTPNQYFNFFYNFFLSIWCIKKTYTLYTFSVSVCAKTLEIRTCWALFMVIALCKWLLMTLLLLSYCTVWPVGKARKQHGI